MRLFVLPVVAALLATTRPITAQTSIASRVAQSPDGVVHLELNARPGVCGNGADVVGYRKSLFGNSFESYGRWSGVQCVPGPLRVSLTVASGQVTQMQTQVGGAWPATRAHATDLGVVASRDAAAFFFTLVPRLENSNGRDRFLLPAVLAADGEVSAPLLALARNDARADRTRRQAVHWLGLLGDVSVVPALVGFARQGMDEDGDDRPGTKGLAGSALAALSQLGDDVGIPALIELARTGNVGTRRNAAFWLGQNGDPRARRMLHSMIEDAHEASRVRSHAIFSLAHGDETPASEFAYLRSVFSRLDDDQLKEAVFQGMTNDAESGGRWLLERARDAHESSRLRKNALFWAGQRAATSTADILAVYRSADDMGLREHAIFVLSQRQDEAAAEALIGIARADSDTHMRAKALFWLAQKNDPRVTKLIADLVLK